MNKEEKKKMQKEKEVEEVLREELSWAEKVFEETPMGPWINGYRTALRTVLKEANRVVEARSDNRPSSGSKKKNRIVDKIGGKKKWK